MNEPPPEIEPLEPMTSGTGGRTARVAALVTVAVLGAFVFVGVAGREPALPAVPEVASPPAAVALSSPVPTPPAPSSTRPQRPPQVESLSDPSRLRPYQFLGIVLTLADQSYLAELQEVRPGHYSAGYRIRLPLPAPTARVELAEIAATTSHDSWESIDRWEVDLDPLLGQLPTAGGTLLATEKPNFYDLDAPELVQLGYEASIRTESRAGSALLHVDVRTAQYQRLFADETYMVTASLDKEVVHAAMTEVSSGRLRATMDLPETDGPIRFEMSRIFSPYPLFGSDVVSDWEMSAEHVEAALETGQSGAFHIEVRPPSEASRYYPRLVQTGFTLTVWVTPEEEGGHLIFHVVTPA